jgi:hypothetical protein
MAATEAEKQQAIDDGLAWLATEQQGDGRWIYDNSWGDVAATGAVLLAFVEEGHTPTSGTTYSANVASGLDWIWQNGIQSVPISNQPAGDPDSNGNGIGYKFNTVASAQIYDLYNTGIVLPTLAKAGPTGTAISSTGSLVDGKTYGQVIQDTVDFLAYAQNEPGNQYDGGWRYTANYPNSDNSVSQWPALALLYAEGAGQATPSWVQSELKQWLQYSQNDTSGGAGYTDPFSTTSLRTGSWLVQAEYAGNLSAAEINAAVDYIDNNWNDGSNFGELYGMWAVYKGLEAAIGIDNETAITNLLTGDCGGDVDNPDHGCNWWEDMNEWLVSNQDAAGFWSQGGRGSAVMKTAWGVNILQAVEIPDNGGVPVPGTLALLAGGLLGGVWVRRRRKLA